MIPVSRPSAYKIAVPLIMTFDGVLVMVFPKFGQHCVLQYVSQHNIKLFFTWWFKA